MKLVGTIHDNVRAAIASARRFHNKPVYTDTLIFWSAILILARDTRAGQLAHADDTLDRLIVDLEKEITSRANQGSSTTLETVSASRLA